MNKIETYVSLMVLLTGISLTGCVSNNSVTSLATDESVNRIADLQITDCLLPGQIRRLGNQTYLTPRRPLRTTQADCRIRGGEFVAYDRADYKTALNVWMPAAKRGDTEAQTNVGEIFERGFKGQPNYFAAAIWYEKAAETGYARAQFNLGTLYEQGLGVDKNAMTALNWYRKAWGIPADDIIFQSAALKQQQAQQQQLQKTINQQNRQISLLKQQIADIIRSSNRNSQTNKQQLRELNEWVTRLKQQKKQTQTRYAAIPASVSTPKQESTSIQVANPVPILREPSVPVPKSIIKPSQTISSDGINFGNYYALIIGNQDYTRIEKLMSPINDAKSVASILQNKYGFSVKTLLNATNVEIMQAINDLNSYLTEQDNLLIFYAGHGNRLKAGAIENSYWLPINADPPPTNTFWVSTDFITRHLARLKAKRIMVVADSCYAGLLSNASNYLLLENQFQYSKKYLRYKLAKKARFVLASGGDRPVLDNAGQGHSVFAKAFLDQLKRNNKVLAAPELYSKIKHLVSRGAKKIGFDQVPTLSVIKGASHEAGDFFFVPVQLTKN